MQARWDRPVSVREVMAVVSVLMHTAACRPVRSRAHGRARLRGKVALPAQQALVPMRRVVTLVHAPNSSAANWMRACAVAAASTAVAICSRLHHNLRVQATDAE